MHNMQNFHEKKCFEIPFFISFSIFVFFCCKLQIISAQECNTSAFKSDMLLLTKTK